MKPDIKAVTKSAWAQNHDATRVPAGFTARKNGEIKPNSLSSSHPAALHRSCSSPGRAGSLPSILLAMPITWEFLRVSLARQDARMEAAAEFPAAATVSLRQGLIIIRRQPAGR